jgi:hypothetical protein
MMERDGPFRHSIHGGRGTREYRLRCRRLVRLRGGSGGGRRFARTSFGRDWSTRTPWCLLSYVVNLIDNRIAMFRIEWRMKLVEVRVSRDICSFAVCRRSGIGAQKLNWAAARTGNDEGDAVLLLRSGELCSQLRS